MSSEQRTPEAMSKHTPGPWDVFGAQDSGSDKWRALTVSQASMPFMRVCFMPSDGTETIMANATLIAAAPDLLAALQGVLRVADRATDEFDAARAAIAKATGAV